jgi:hypothetical protein
MPNEDAEKAKRKNYDDLKRAGAQKDANATQRLKRSWIARELALASSSPTLVELILATAQGLGRRFASLLLADDRSVARSGGSGYKFT